MSTYVKRSLIGLVVIVAMAVSAELRLLPGLPTILRVDNEVHRWALDHQSTWLTALMRVISDLADAPFVVFVGALLLIPAVRSRRFARWFFFVTCTLGGAVLSRAIKILVGRERPPFETRAVFEASPAWPSGHSVQAVVFYGALALLVKRRWATWIAVAMTLLVGASRVYLGVHWPTDVLAGWLVGACWLIVVWSVFGLRGVFSREPGADGDQQVGDAENEEEGQRRPLVGEAQRER